MHDLRSGVTRKVQKEKCFLNHWKGSWLTNCAVDSGLLAVTPGYRSECTLIWILPPKVIDGLVAMVLGIGDVKSESNF